MQVVTLTTEWKPDDIYTGMIKGMLCSLCPGTMIIDNASGIPAFNIAHASFVIRNTYNKYPKGSIHIICVRSEAADKQDHLIVRAKGHLFIGNDNGIFNLILNSDPEEVVRISHEGTNDELEIYSNTVSELLKGKKPADLGTTVNSFSEKLPLRATIDKDVIIGSIIFIDSYGNVISNITREIFNRVFEGREFRISVQSTKNYTNNISLRYSDVPMGELLTKFNPVDLLEISINGANISELLSISIGSVVRVDLASKAPSPNRLF
jgi:S-adenosyl-L-methionine hydrolase (adenosine-forming)